MAEAAAPPRGRSCTGRSSQDRAPAVIPSRAIRLETGQQWGSPSVTRLGRCQARIAADLSQVLLSRLGCDERAYRVVLITSRLAGLYAIWR